MDLLSATLTLILIMDPLGNIPMFLSILNKIPDENRRRKILIRESVTYTHLTLPTTPYV